jgi:histidyl-tRNA synthetase
VWLEEQFRAVARLYGYHEIRTPTFEDTDLFIRSSGETSDIVSKQMYTFEDKGGRSITLKPEGTAPAIRAIVEHSLYQQGQVLRLSYVTPIFRYERPQKGRLREAHQVGLELIGSESSAADAEIIEITVRFYESIGVQGVNVLLNSLGRSECRTRYRAAILEFAKEFLEGQADEVREKANKNPLRLLDSKDPAAQEALKAMPPVTEYLEPESKERFEELQKLLTNAGVPFQVEPSIVRGLDYYTETVFEVHSTHLGAQSALCGGGRYDELMGEMGGPSTPSVGVAMGIERALMVLDALGTAPESKGPDVFVVQATTSARDAALLLAREFRGGGLAAMLDYDGKGMKAQFKQADRSGARFAAILGDDELARGEVTIKDLKGGEQISVPLGEAVTSIREKL